MLILDSLKNIKECTEIKNILFFHTKAYSWALTSGDRE
jgi:hypothetical protein